MTGPVVAVALAILVVAAGLCVVRLLTARSTPDRVVALETLLVTTVSGIAVYSVRVDTTAYLTVLVVTSLVGFVSTVTVARFIERWGSRPPGRRIGEPGGTRDEESRG